MADNFSPENDDEAQGGFQSPFVDENLTPEEEAAAVSAAFQAMHDHLAFLAVRFGVLGAVGMLRAIFREHQELARSYVGDQLSAVAKAHLDGADPETASKDASERFVAYTQALPFLATTDLRFRNETVYLISSEAVEIHEGGMAFRIGVEARGTEDSQALRERALKILCAVAAYLNRLREA